MPAVISRLTAEWQTDCDAWQKRDLSARRYVYVWADIQSASPVPARKPRPGAPLAEHLAEKGRALNASPTPRDSVTDG